MKIKTNSSKRERLQFFAKFNSSGKRFDITVEEWLPFSTHSVWDAILRMSQWTGRSLVGGTSTYEDIPKGADLGYIVKGNGGMSRTADDFLIIGSKSQLVNKLSLVHSYGRQKFTFSLDGKTDKTLCSFTITMRVGFFGNPYVPELENDAQSGLAAIREELER